MQPVTMTLPFSAIASPMAESDSALALSRKPQVLTITTSAPSCLRASSYPSALSCVMMRSESTSAFGQPSETKETLGAAPDAGSGIGARSWAEAVIETPKPGGPSGGDGADRSCQEGYSGVGNTGNRQKSGRDRLGNAPAGACRRRPMDGLRRSRRGRDGGSRRRRRDHRSGAVPPDRHLRQGERPADRVPDAADLA